MRSETARTDSVRAVVLDQALSGILAVQQRTIDSLVELQRRLADFRGDVRTELTEVQRQLVQIQELTGQSQQRISDLRLRLDQREPVLGAPGGVGTVPGQPSASADAEELFTLSLDQLRKGSPQTARAGFQALITTYPNDPIVARAWFFIGETWEQSDPDSAATAYRRVVDQHRESRHAPTALYRLGLIAEARGNQAAARGFFQAVVRDYPRSEEASLARAKLGTPGV